MTQALDTLTQLVDYAQELFPGHTPEDAFLLLIRKLSEDIHQAKHGHRKHSAYVVDDQIGSQPNYD